MSDVSQDVREALAMILRDYREAKPRCPPRGGRGGVGTIPTNDDYCVADRILASLPTSVEREPVAICCMERWKPGMEIYAEPGCGACDLEIEALRGRDPPREDET